MKINVNSHLAASGMPDDEAEPSATKLFQQFTELHDTRKWYKKNICWWSLQEKTVSATIKVWEPSDNLIRS